jgi:AraC-like DNA-binding protein
MPSYATGRLRRKLPDAEIVRLYVEEKLDSDTIGARAGCSSTTVLDLVRAAGGTVRKPGAPRQRAVLLIPDAEIIRRYRAGDSGPLIAYAAGCTPSTVYRILKDHGIAVRPPPNRRGRLAQPGSAS